MIITTHRKRFIALCEYREKDIAKGAGFRWNRTEKVWWTKDAVKAAKLLQYADGNARKQIEQQLHQAQASRQLSRATDSDIAIPAPAGLDYLPYQLAGIQYALARESTLIGDEMGLGKTIQAIGVLNADTDIERALVICPASLRLNWQRELRKWLTRPLTVGIAIGKHWPSTSVIIINYDILNKPPPGTPRSDVGLDGGR